MSTHPDEPRVEAGNLERKTFPVASFKVVDGPKGIAEAIVAVFGNVDKGDDRILPGAFRNTLGRKMPKGVWMHDWKIPVAKTPEARELLAGDPMLPESIRSLGGLWVKGHFNLATQRGREAFSDLEFGTVDEFSIGYQAIKSRRDPKTGVRDLIEVDLIEWSPVLMGMNPSTALLSLKADPKGAVMGDAMDEADDAGGAALADDGEAEGRPKVGDHVKWSYGKGEAKCAGYGKVKSLHAKGEDMPDADNLDGDDGDEKAAKPPAKCPHDGVLVKCYGVEGPPDAAAWKPTGKHEFHPETKMTVLHDGLAAASESAKTFRMNTPGGNLIEVEIIADDAFEYTHLKMGANGKLARGSMGMLHRDPRKSLPEGFDGFLGPPNAAPKSVPPLIKSMLAGPFLGYPNGYFRPFDKWEESAVLNALESLGWRLQSAVCSVINSDVLDVAAKAEMIGQVIDSYRPAVLRVVTAILAREESEEATTKAARSLAIVARERVKAIEAPYRTSDDDPASGESFGEWFDATVSVASELRDALTRRCEVRQKAGRVLSGATLSQINAAIEALASASDALVTLRDKATAKPIEPSDVAAKAAPGDTALATRLRADAIRRDQAMRELNRND